MSTRRAGRSVRRFWRPLHVAVLLGAACALLRSLPLSAQDVLEAWPVSQIRLMD